MTMNTLFDAKTHDRSNFSPTRLTVARQTRGLTKKALADLCGLTAPSITQFEAGTNGPDLSTVDDMASVLGFPREFFFDPELNLIPEESLTFRSRRSMTAALRSKAAASAIIVSDVISPAIRKKFRLPKPDMPDLSENTPEDAAALIRLQWQLGYGPITNVVHLLEGQGVEVYWLREQASSLDAFSWWENDSPFIILNSTKTGGDRGRFDAAHELAHLLIHRTEKDLDSRRVEAEADRFASAFLMPAEQFGKECPRHPVLEYFKSLKKRWGVSLAAMVRRCRDIGVFTEWQYECACREIATNGWKTNEPWKVERERSQIHELVFDRLYKNDVPPERFAQQLSLPLEHLETLIPVATKFHEISVYMEDEYSLETLRQVDAAKGEAVEDAK